MNRGKLSLYILMSLKPSERGTSICLLTPKSGNVVIQTRIIERSALNGNHITVGT